LAAQGLRRGSSGGACPTGAVLPVAKEPNSPRVNRDSSPDVESLTGLGLTISSVMAVLR